MLAWQSGDQNLLQALSERRDLHQETADFFGLSRREGKDINLGLGYGMSAQGLSARLGISLDDAENGIRIRNAKYPDVQIWSDRRRNEANALDHVQTSLGRRLWINRYDKQWTRHAINLPIQGTAAEHTKMWFGLCHNLAIISGRPFRIPLVVHDELVADVRRSEVTEFRKTLEDMGIEAGRKVMSGFEMSISTSVGKSWGDKAK